MSVYLSFKYQSNSVLNVKAWFSSHSHENGVSPPSRRGPRRAAEPQLAKPACFPQNQGRKGGAWASDADVWSPLRGHSRWHQRKTRPREDKVAGRRVAPADPDGRGPSYGVNSADSHELPGPYAREHALYFFGQDLQQREFYNNILLAVACMLLYG